MKLLVTEQEAACAGAEAANAPNNIKTDDINIPLATIPPNARRTYVIDVHRVECGAVPTGSRSRWHASTQRMPTHNVEHPIDAHQLYDFGETHTRRIATQQS